MASVGVNMPALKSRNFVTFVTAWPQPEGDVMVGVITSTPVVLPFESTAKTAELLVVVLIFCGGSLVVTLSTCELSQGRRTATPLPWAKYANWPFVRNATSATGELTLTCLGESWGEYSITLLPAAM